MKANQCKMILLAIGTTVGVYLGFKYILPLVVPFLFAYFLAKMLVPIITFLHEKLKLPKTLSSMITVITLALLVGCAIFCLGRVFLQQLQSLIQNIPVYQKMFTERLSQLCEHCNKLFGWEDGVLMKWMDGNMEQMRGYLRSKVMPSMTQHTIQGVLRLCGIGAVFFLIIISVIMILKDMDDIREEYEKSCFYKQIHPITGYLSKVGYAYLKAQLIIISLVITICTIGLVLIHNNYALVISIGIGLFDAVPLLGSGTILVPWAIWKMINGNMADGAILLTLYLCCQLIRQLLEPKLIGDRIGIKPIFTIMAMYAGVKIFGLEGFFLGPIALVIVRAVIQNRC